jgi:hypothetical protein
MSTFINRNLPDSAFNAATNSNTPSSTNPFATQLDLANINNPGDSNLLLTGGASWSGTGMAFNTTTLTYQITGIVYTASPQTITLSTGDPSNPRFDAIVVNAAGVVSVIPGTPSPNPLTPAVDENYVLIQYVLVAAGATAPSIVNEFVYRDGSSPDWLTASVPGAAPSLTANFSSTFPTPFEGTECTFVTAPTYNTGKYIQYTKPSGSISRAAYSFLTFRVNLNAPLPTRNIYVFLFNGTTFIGAVYATAWGLNMNVAGPGWQLVSIPTAAFGNAAITTITRVRFFLTGTAANTFATGFDRYAIDDVKFQTGFGPQSNVATIDILQNGTTIDSTSKLNFIESTGLNISVFNNTAINTVDITPTLSGKTDVNTISISVLTLDQTYSGQVLVLDISTDISLPLNSVIPIAIGSTFKVVNQGVTPITILGTTPAVLINSLGNLNSVASSYGVVTITKLGNNFWLLEGDLI